GFNRTMVGWKLVPEPTVRRARHRFNRTMVGWKQQCPAGATVQTARFNRTMVGWKREPESEPVASDLPAFQSNHGGMETGEHERADPAHFRRFNRTMVGWKRREDGKLLFQPPVSI